jgi:hypothetical protein
VVVLPPPLSVGVGHLQVLRIITGNEMVEETSNNMKSRAVELFCKECGPPSRETVKVKAWDIRRDLGVVV